MKDPGIIECPCPNCPAPSMCDGAAICVEVERAALEMLSWLDNAGLWRPDDPDFIRARRRLRDAVGSKPLTVETLRTHLREVCDLAIWMSGSPSFAPEGEAHEGWVKGREKLFAALEALRGSKA